MQSQSIPSIDSNESLLINASPIDCKSDSDDDSMPEIIHSIDIMDDIRLNEEDENEQQMQLTKREKRKLIQIYDAINENNIDQLILLSDSEGGLLLNKVRKKVWPKLLACNSIVELELPSDAQMKTHVYYDQVVLDVDRSIKRFPPSIKETQRLAMQDQLVRLIVRILICNPSLHYYQGFHDICVTFLIILGEEQAFHAMNNLVNSHLHRYMEKTTDSIVNILELIPLLVERKDSVLFEFLEKSEVGNIYGLSWVLTWFAHSLTSYRQLGRLFDLFIVNHELFCVYVVAAIVLFKRDEILDLECSLAGVYSYLNKLIEREEEQLPFEQLIENARTLIHQYPPESLADEQIRRVRHKQRIDQMHRQKVSSSSSTANGLDRRLVIAASVFAASAAVYVLTRNFSNTSNF